MQCMKLKGLQNHTGDKIETVLNGLNFIHEGIYRCYNIRL